MVYSHTCSCDYKLKKNKIDQLFNISKKYNLFFPVLKLKDQKFFVPNNKNSPISFNSETRIACKIFFFFTTS